MALAGRQRQALMEWTCVKRFCYAVAEKELRMFQHGNRAARSGTVIADRRRMKPLMLSILVLLILGTSILLVVVYTGAYNVAATQPHTAFTRWLFSTTMENSVRARAADIDPPELTKAMAEAGFAHYDPHCKGCHGAPGVELSHAGQGLRPPPPDLSETSTRWSAGELFWIIKHGIRMTGMPAWTVSYDDTAIWQIAAFVRQLPGMDAETYRARMQQLHTHDESSATADGRGKRHTVEMTNTLNYTPKTLTIHVGDTITWRNTSNLVHTVTADPALAGEPDHVQLPAQAAPFDSGEISPGSSFTRRFSEAGRYRYFCIPHESAGMVGELIVEDGNPKE